MIPQSILDRAMSIPGWFTRRECEWLWTEALDHTVILEIGCWLGRTTSILTSMPDGITYSVDHFLGSPGENQNLYENVANHPDARQRIINQFKQLHKVALDSGQLFLLEADNRSAYWALDIILRHRKLDMAFIDGGHDHESVRCDINNCLRLLRPGGLLCGHDHNAGYPGVTQTVNALLPERELIEDTTLWAYRKPDHSPASP